MPGIPANQEAETGGSLVWDLPGQLHETLCQRLNSKEKRKKKQNQNNWEESLVRQSPICARSWVQYPVSRLFHNCVTRHNRIAIPVLTDILVVSNLYL